MGLLIMSYREPRVLKANGSCSKTTVAHQGNLAGCAHATTCLSVMLYRALRRVSALNSYIRPRGLVDDVSLQWVATNGAKIDELQTGVKQFFDDVKELNLVLQTSKSGFIATTQRLVRLFTPRAKRLGLVRNKGHQEPGARNAWHEGTAQPGA